MLHNAINIINDKKDRLDVANIFLLAREKVLASIAFKEVFTYLYIRKELLGSESWKEQYNLALKMYDATTKATFGAGKYAEMKKSINIVLNNTTSILHLVNIYNLKIKFYNNERKFENAIDTARRILDKIGESIFNLFPEIELERAKNLIVGKSNEVIPSMKKMTNDVSNVAIRTLNEIVTSSYIAKPELIFFIATKIVQLTFQNGVSKYSTFSFCTLRALLCKNQDQID